MAAWVGGVRIGGVAGFSGVAANGEGAGGVRFRMEDVRRRAPYPDQV